ncbi:Hsp70 family protein [Streptomyces sp. NRRL S-118]|uniref:Hsp70 family protein n=1 Tax=Streptomyces sp. NRRL S-118 TaxID=1463881 RepID=UPI000694B944|nr:Hsp70 family protein [Streptomyces sp. NRRL S-118]
MFPLGIDLGTTFTGAALWRNGRAETVPLGQQHRSDLVPSVLYWERDGTLLVGDNAWLRGATDPARMAQRFKPLMGQSSPVITGGTNHEPHELTGHLLRWVLDTVSDLEGARPGHVVLTHPAGWEDHRRQALIQAASIAGLGDVGLLPEPIAAGTFYVSQQRIVPVRPGALIGIYDLGGGTFDATVVRKSETGVEIYGEPDGNDLVGGIHFDDLLMEHVQEAAGVTDRFDLDDPTDEADRLRLMDDVIRAKEALSSLSDVVVPVRLPGVTRQVDITRAGFEALIQPMIMDTIGVFADVLDRAGVSPAQLDAVLLVGGSSRIPLVTRLLEGELGISVRTDAHSKHVVSLGAAIAAAPRHREAEVRRTPYAPAPTPAMAPEEGPELSVVADLERTGLTAATDTRVHIVIEGQTVTVDTLRDGGTRRGGLGALVVVGLVLAVLALVVVVAFQNRTT